MLDGDGDNDGDEQKTGAEGADGEVRPPEGQQAAEGQTKTQAEEKVDTVDDKTKGPGPGPAMAGATASRAGAGRPMTEQGVLEILKRAQEEERLRGVVLGRMPAGSDNLVASMTLPQLREAARSIKAPAAPPGTGGNGGGALTAGKGASANADADLTPAEAYRIERWRESFGIEGTGETDSNVVAARAAWKADPVGGEVSVEPFKVLLRGPTGRKGAPATATH
jgi:hypothetical protein